MNHESVAWAHPDNDPIDDAPLDPWADDPELCGIPGGHASRDIGRHEEEGRRRTPPGSPSSLAGATSGLVRRWAPNAWTVLAAATLVQSCAGLAYSFSVYSGSLREVYQSQSAVDLLGSFKDVGAYFGVLGGLVFDAFGPRVTLLAGAAMHTAGYLGVYATLRGDVAGFRRGSKSSKNVPPLWRTGCVIALAANGDSFLDTAVLLTSMNNFPTDKGTVAGLLKSYLGLSSAVFAQFYVTVAPPRDDAASAPRPADGAAAAATSGGGDDDARARVFVLMIALVGGAVATLAAPFVREVGKSLNGGGSGGWVGSSVGRGSFDAAATFAKLTTCTVALVGCAAAAAALNDAFGPLERVVNVALACVVLFALASPTLALLAGGKLSCVVAKPRSALRSERGRRRTRGGRGGSSRGGGRSVTFDSRSVTFDSRSVTFDSRSVTFDSSADVGGRGDGNSLGTPLLRGWGTTTDGRFVDDGSGDVPSDDEEDASSRSSDERGRLGDDHEWAANRAQILDREGAFLHARDEREREDLYDGDFDVVHGGVGSAPPIPGTIALGGVEQPPLLGRDSSSLTLSECATCPEFWLLWCSIAASSGAAMALVNNMDAIAIAAGMGDGAAAGMVSLFSVCNCVGRLCGGLASEWALHVREVPRPAGLCVAQAVVAIGASALRVAPVRGGVFAAVSLVGFALGAHWGLAPSMSSEIFGAKHAGAVYGGLSVAPMIGSYALSTGVFGRMYDAAAAAQAAAAGGASEIGGGSDLGGGSGLSTGNSTVPGGGDASGGVDACVGPDCFSGAMGVCAAFALAATVPCAIVSARTRHVYAHHRRRILASAERAVVYS